MRRTLMLLTFAALAPGCRNACQVLCKEIYEYAEDCDLRPYTEGPGGLKDCYEQHSSSNVPRSERRICRDKAANLRTEWDCDYLAEYFDEADASGKAVWDVIKSTPGDTGSW